MSRLIYVGALITLGVASVSAPTQAQAGVRYWHGGDMRYFHVHDYPVWRTGRWQQSWHDGRWGWWWLVGSSWYFYPRPIYPYPDPYLPPTVVVQPQPQVIYQQQPQVIVAQPQPPVVTDIQPQVAVPPGVGAPQAENVPPPPAANATPVKTVSMNQAAATWYHCSKPDGYYPYVASCAAGWVAVPATPAGVPGNTQ